MSAVIVNEIAGQDIAASITSKELERIAVRAMLLRDGLVALADAIDYAALIGTDARLRQWADQSARLVDLAEDCYDSIDTIGLAWVQGTGP